MNRPLLGIVAWTAFTLGAASPSEAAKPPAGGGPSFTQCAPSGYNCNILITLTREGNLLVESNPNLTCFPLPSGCYDSGGQRIGFQNNFNATVYSLSFKVKPGTSATAAWVCDVVAFNRAVDNGACPRFS